MMLETGIERHARRALSIHLSDSVSVEGKVVLVGRTLLRRRAGPQPIDCAATLERLHAEQRSPRFRPLRLPVAARATAYCERGLHMVKW